MASASPAHQRRAGYLTFLVAGTVAVVVLGVTIDLVHYHLRPIEGLRTTFRLNGEANVASWWNSMLLLTGAGLAAVSGVTSSARAQKLGWFAVSAAMTGLSLDEAVQLHERLTLLAPYLPETGTYQWVAPGALLALVGLGILVVALRALPRQVRRGLAAAVVVYLSGAVGVESVNGWINSTRGIGDLYRLSTAVEESLEMGGCLIAISVLMTAAGGLAPLVLPTPRQVVPPVVVAWCVVAALALCVTLLVTFAPGSSNAYHVHLWREGNTTTWLQAGLWWSAAALFLHASSRVSGARRRALLAVAVVTAMVSASEMGRLHELAGRIVFPPVAVPRSVLWVPLGLVAAAGAIVLLRRASLPDALRRSLGRAVVLLGVGAVAGELLDALLRRGDGLVGRALVAAVGESVEAVAALLTVCAALVLLREVAPRQRSRTIA